MDAMQAVFLGLGVSFLIFGLPIMRRISPDSKARAWAMYLSIAWLMISWWPHIGMHVSNAPDDLQRLIYIDYLFHVPLMIAGGVLAYCFFSLVRQRGWGTIPQR
jgi:predicted membrane channel-forming protein YqfA (hemolysin III family)